MVLFFFRRIVVRIVSSAQTGYFYTMTRNRLRSKLEFMKYDPVGKAFLFALFCNCNSFLFSVVFLIATLYVRITIFSLFYATTHLYSPLAPRTAFVSVGAFGKVLIEAPLRYTRIDCFTCEICRNQF